MALCDFAQCRAVSDLQFRFFFVSRSLLVDELMNAAVLGCRALVIRPELAAFALPFVT